MNPDPSGLLIQLFVIFLNGIVDRDITSVSTVFLHSLTSPPHREENWQSFLKLHLRWRCDFLNEKWDPFQTKGCDYRGLTARDKIELLHKLCHWRLELDDVGDLVRVSGCGSGRGCQLVSCVCCRATMDHHCGWHHWAGIVTAISTGSSMGLGSTEKLLPANRSGGRRQKIGWGLVVDEERPHPQVRSISSLETLYSYTMCTCTARICNFNGFHLSLKVVRKRPPLHRERGWGQGQLEVRPARRHLQVVQEVGEQLLPKKVTTCCRSLLTLVELRVESVLCDKNPTLASSNTTNITTY